MKFFDLMKEAANEVGLELTEYNMSNSLNI